MAELFAAAVEIDITPPVGTGFDGYAARQASSIGVHDPLLAQLLLLKSGSQMVAVICLDLLGVSLDFTNQVRRGIQEAIGVPGECVLVACSHTHSGAAGFLPPHPGIKTSPDAGLQQWLTRQLIGAARWAAGSLQPARLGVGQGAVAGIGLNRNNPQGGAVDEQVTVLQIENESNKPLAVLMNYGCHPTVLGYENLYFSADFPGAARAILRQINPQTIFLFTNGASGDISTRFTRRSQDFAEVDRLGRLLAGEVLKVMQLILTQPDAKLSGKVAEVELKYRDFPTPQVARQELERLQAELDELKAAHASHGELRRAITRLEGAQGQALMAQELAGCRANRSQVQVLQIGELALVALPGEPFTPTVLEIKRRSPKACTAVVSYANDYQGYFPDAQSILEGSYEALISPYAADIAEIFSETALNLIT